jgi:hypothetical protein
MEYKKIEGCPNYMISNTGMVLNISKNKHLKNTLGDRYLVVSLFNKGLKKRHYVHRLVAEAFCEKEISKNYVNHKDLDRCNNNSSNLEWVTSSENRKHFISSDKYKPRLRSDEEKLKIKLRNYKKVLCLSTNTIFESMGHFAEHRNISIGQVSQKLNNIYNNNLNAILI